MQPKPGSLVLGGQAQPLPGSLVLGGHGQWLGKLFERFIAEALPCNGEYLRLQISDRLSLVRRRKAEVYGDIKIKYYYTTTYIYAGQPRTHQYWDFAGYLKHGGVLFGCRAEYITPRCLKEIRPIVLHGLIQASIKS